MAGVEPVKQMMMLIKGKKDTVIGLAVKMELNLKLCDLLPRRIGAGAVELVIILMWQGHYRKQNLIY